MTKRRNGQAGNAIIEFALGLGVLWLLFSGVYKFGYSFYLYNKLETSVSVASEFACRQNYDTGNPSAFSNTIKNLVVYGDVNGGTKPVVPGLTTANVGVAINPVGSIPTDITITIQNYTLSAIFQSWTLNGKPRVTTVYMGKVVCATC